MVPGAIEQGSAQVAMGRGEFVPVAFPARRDAAEALVSILERNDVPAMIDDGASGGESLSGLGRGVAVLVPAHLHDTASEIIAQDDEDMEEDDDLYEDDEFEDDDIDDLDDLDDDFDEDDDDDFDPDVDEEEDLE